MNLRNRLLFAIAVSMLVFSSCADSRDDIALENELISLHLRLDESNVPYIAGCNSVNEAKYLFRGSARDRTGQEPLKASKIKLSENQFFKIIEISGVNDSLEITWLYSLAKNLHSYSAKMKLKNRSAKKISVPEFPVFNETLLTGNKNLSIKYWKSLSYMPVLKTIKQGDSLSLFSKMYSSEEPDFLPYWEISGDSVSIFSSLAWCGGWKSDFAMTSDGLTVKTYLPEEETRLELSQGEEITGPELLITVTTQADGMHRRQEWLKEREEWSYLLYKKPAPLYPLVYNSWYAVEFDLSKEFIVNQLKVMEPYGFNAFVVDAGWYEKVGKWIPDSKKFPGKSLNEAFAEVNNKGIISGIWSCPQLMAAEDTTRLSTLRDKPGRYVPFMKAYLIDMAGTDFTRSLLEHVSSLRNSFNISWWKYDQDFFAAETKQGKMRNVIAFHTALGEVRKNFPDLYIENCMSGGRMVNEFTNSIAQIHWPKDVYNKGLEHAWSNFCENLGALQVMQPYMNQKWINNPEKLPGNDTSLISFYAQSCLPGTFGISADLYKIPRGQKEIFLREIANYRKLNRWKGNYLYDIHYPRDENDAGFVAFYSNDLDSVAVVCGRKSAGKQQQIDIPVSPSIKKDQSITITLPAGQHSKISFLKIN